MCFITSLYKLQSGTIQLQGVSVYFFKQIFLNFRFSWCIKMFDKKNGII